MRWETVDVETEAVRAGVATVGEVVELGGVRNICGGPTAAGARGCGASGCGGGGPACW